MVYVPFLWFRDLSVQGAVMSGGLAEGGQLYKRSEISHCDCVGVNCTQKSRQRGAQQLGTLRAQKIYEELRQFVW